MQRTGPLSCLGCGSRCDRLGGLVPCRPLPGERPQLDLAAREHQPPRLVNESTRDPVSGALTARDLKDRDVAIDTQTWNRRYREYMEKINTGSIYGIAEVLRDLHLLKTEKELSFG